jgi:hypothetical protein
MASASRKPKHRQELAIPFVCVPVSPEENPKQSGNETKKGQADYRNPRLVRTSLQGPGKVEKEEPEHQPESRIHLDHQVQRAHRWEELRAWP